ncbi:MAG: hypothetical protein Q9217_002384 [Psora testacea]
MAVFPKANAFDQGSNLATAPAQPIDIETWTEQATKSLNAVTLSSQGGVRGTSVSLAIGLDEPAKGQPPLPSDWEIHPTYPRHAVPYFLAPLWDQDMAAKAEAKKKKQVTARRQAQAKNEGQGTVPRELREKLKKAKAAKGLLKDLEEQVRVFVKSWEGKTEKKCKPELDSEDEEIVFVGRNGHMHDVPTSQKLRDSIDQENFERDRLVFDSLANDRGASFGQVPFNSSLTTRC